MDNDKSQEVIKKSWERVLSDEGEIREFFKMLNIKCPNNIQVLLRTTTVDDRLTIMAGASDETGKPMRIIIDATSGVPTWAQFINVTYDQGSDTDIKIILYDHGYVHDDIDADVAPLTESCNLVRRNNKCHVPTYLAGGITIDHNGQKILRSCTVLKYQNEEAVDDESWTFPSKRQIQEAEFWVNYYYPHWKRSGAWPIGVNDDLTRFWHPSHELGNNVKTLVYWNDEGFFFNVVGEADSKAIQWIWEKKKSSFQEKFPGCPISLKTEGGQSKSISIRVCDVPMAELIEMEPKDKWHYGKMVFDGKLDFYVMAQNVVDDYCKDSKTTSVNASV